MMVRSEAAAEESLAAIRARIRLGIAIAAMIRIIATTIRSSINEKPFCCLRISIFVLVAQLVEFSTDHSVVAHVSVLILHFPFQMRQLLWFQNRLTNSLVFSGRANCRFRS